MHYINYNVSKCNVFLKINPCMHKKAFVYVFYVLLAFSKTILQFWTPCIHKIRTIYCHQYLPKLHKIMCDHACIKK